MINEISLAQIILVEVGAMFQVAALCTSISKASSRRNMPGALEHKEKSAAKEEMMPLRVEEHEFELSKQDEDFYAESLPRTRAGDLMKTARIPFAQSFKSNKSGKRLHLSGQW